MDYRMVGAGRDLKDSICCSGQAAQGPTQTSLEYLQEHPQLL